MKKIQRSESATLLYVAQKSRGILSIEGLWGAKVISVPFV